MQPKTKAVAQEKLLMFKDRQLIHFEEDPYDSGFYLLGCRPFDKKLVLFHSQHPNFEIRINRTVEQKYFEVNDLCIKRKLRKSDDEEEQMKQVISMHLLGMQY